MYNNFKYFYKFFHIFTNKELFLNLLEILPIFPIHVMTHLYNNK